MVEEMEILEVGGGRDTSAFMIVCLGTESMEKTFFRWIRLWEKELALGGRVSGAAGRGGSGSVLMGAGRCLTAVRGGRLSSSPPGSGAMISGGVGASCMAASFWIGEL
jgi:hypothetical protein